MQEIIELIRAANPKRSMPSLPRRFMKLTEELGEVAEAYLNVTSKANDKCKTWDDVREECADVLIVAFDIALTMNDFVIEHFGSSDIENFSDILFDLNGSMTRLYFCSDSSCLDEDEVNYFVDLVTSLALMMLPDRPSIELDDQMIQLKAEVIRKLKKWTKAVDNQTDVTEFVL